MHEIGFVHGDLKSGNLLFRKGQGGMFWPILADFERAGTLESDLKFHVHGPDERVKVYGWILPNVDLDIQHASEQCCHVTTYCGVICTLGLN